MKKITRKDLQNKPVVKIGYCGAQNLLSGAQRIGYTSGIYGWNADVFDMGAAYIVTGYRFHGIGGKWADAAALDHLEKAAGAVLSDRWIISPARLESKLRALRAALIDQTL